MAVSWQRESRLAAPLRSFSPQVCGGNAGALIRFGKLLRAAPAWGAFFDDKARSEGAPSFLLYV